MMTHTPPKDRCRLVLIAPDWDETGRLVEALGEAFEGGDVAALILPAYGLDEATFQDRAEAVMALTAGRDCAVMIVDDTRIAGRVGADGVHLENAKKLLGETPPDHKLMIGAGGAKTRHEALELGEARPDYIFFGRVGYDTKPEPHARNLSLGQWWAELVEVPCVVLGGSELGSVVPVAETRADFVALSAAIFGDDADPREAVRRVNALLEEAAPRLETAQ